MIDAFRAEQEASSFVVRRPALHPGRLGMKLFAAAQI